MTLLRGARRALLAGTALTGVSLALLVALPAGAVLLLGLSSPALAAGGRGGNGPVSGGGTGGAGPFEGVDGGTGGNGGDGNTSSGGAGGGGGGAGGGAGGNGGDGGNGTTIGAGGGGGTGGVLPGEAGTDGDDGPAATNGGGGGGGGGAHGFTGVVLPGGALIGGAGGNGGNALFPASNGGGGGGEGGYGAYITAGGANITSSITGGAGGIGGNSGGFGGSGGTGGIGVFFASPATLINSGSIVGGAGGTPGDSSFNILGDEGQGGAGVAGNDLTIINSGTISGGLGSDGVRANAVTFTGGSNFLTFGGATSGLTGNIAVNGLLTLDQSTGVATTTVDSDITGPGSVIKAGGGTITLTGINNTYTGNTTVNGGTLLVDGAILSDTTVNAGGALGGTGSVGSVMVNANGVFAPGDGTPNTHIGASGTLDFSGGGTYRVFVSPSTASWTDLAGTATLTGGTVNAVFSPVNGYTAKQYLILQTGGLGGTRFSPEVDATNLPANFSASLSYSPDDLDVFLNLALVFSTPGSLNGNQQAVADALTNFFDSTGGIPTAFTTLTPDQLTQASGEGGTGTIQTSFDAMGLFLNTMLGPFNGGRFGSGGGATGFADENAAAALGYAGAQAYAAVTPKDRMPVKAAAFDRRWSGWASGYGGSSKVSGDAAAGSHDTTSRIYGIAAGADYRPSPDTLLGFALGGAGFNFGLSDGLGSGRADLFQAGVYARHWFGRAYIAGAAAYGWQDVKTERTVTISGTDRLEAEFHAQTYAARGEAGYRYATPWLGVTPYAALQVTSFHQPSYAESETSGSGQFALSYDSQTTTNLRTELGAQFDKSFLLADGLLTLRARAAWAHDSDTGRPVTAMFQTLPGGAAFTVNGAEPAADSALVSAGAEMRWAHGLSLAANFEGEFSGTTQSYAGKAKLSYAW